MVVRSIHKLPELTHYYRQFLTEPISSRASRVPLIPHINFDSWNTHHGWRKCPNEAPAYPWDTTHTYQPLYATAICTCTSRVRLLVSVSPEFNWWQSDCFHMLHAACYMHAYFCAARERGGMSGKVNVRSYSPHLAEWWRRVVSKVLPLTLSIGRKIADKRDKKKRKSRFGRIPRHQTSTRLAGGVAESPSFALLQWIRFSAQRRR